VSGASGGREKPLPLPLAKPLPATNMENRSIAPSEELLCLALWVGAVLVRDLLIPIAAVVLTVAGWRASSEAHGLVQGQPAGAQASPAPEAHGLVQGQHAATNHAREASYCARAFALDLQGQPLASLPVKELRLLARAAGHRSLARSGRRAELLAVLV
jgi:hypothetical protein